MLVPDPGDPKIFLVDEDDIVRDSLKILLESHGMRVQEFRGTRDFLARGGIGPGARLDGVCLVLGFNRLIMDGLDLMSALQSRGIAMPVIFIVGGGDQLQKLTVHQAGAFAYLERPIQEAALIRAIRSAVAGPVAESGKDTGAASNAAFSSYGKTR